MADIAEEALEGLNVSLQVLMPLQSDLGVDLITMVNPLSITPTGVGGLIDIDQEPAGDILGRRIEASVVVILRERNLAPLQGAATTLTRALLGAERKTLLDLGVLHIRQESSSYRYVAKENQEIELIFHILFEYQKLPEEAEEMIEEIPVNINLLE